MRKPESTLTINDDHNRSEINTRMNINASTSSADYFNTNNSSF